VFTYDVATLIELIESKPCLWDKTSDSYNDKIEKSKAWREICSNRMYPVLSFAFFVFSPKIQEHKQVALPISVYKHLSCAAFQIKLTSGSGNAGTCEKLHDRSRIRLRQKSGVCSSALKYPRTA